MPVNMKISRGYEHILGLGAAGMAINSVMLLRHSICFASISASAMLTLAFLMWWYYRYPCVRVEFDGVYLLAPLRTKRIGFDKISSWSYSQSRGALRLEMQGGKSVTRLVSDENLAELEACLVTVGIPKAGG